MLHGNLFLLWRGKAVLILNRKVLSAESTNLFEDFPLSVQISTTQMVKSCASRRFGAFSVAHCRMGFVTQKWSLVNKEMVEQRQPDSGLGSSHILKKGQLIGLDPWH